MQHRRVLSIILLAVLVGACAGAPSTGDPGASTTTGELRVITPRDGATVETASITLAGTAPTGARIVHDIPFGPDAEVLAADGTWTLEVELDEGLNEITVRLEDDESTAQTLRLTYRPTTAAADTPAPTATPEPTEVATPEPTPEPTPKPTPEPTPTPTKVEYKTVSNRGWALIVKSPDDFVGRTFKVWACISQFDAATGPDTFRGQASNKEREYWYSDGDNALFTGDEEQLADFVQDDVVVMNVTAAGSFSYDTQVGGNTTVPWFFVEKITRKGSCD